MIGYDFEHDDGFGLCLAAVRQLTIALDGGNAEDRAYQFSIGLRVYELRKKTALLTYSITEMSALSARAPIDGFTSEAKQKYQIMGK